MEPRYKEKIFQYILIYYIITYFPSFPFVSFFLVYHHLIESSTMGRDHTTKQHARHSQRTAPKSDNVYLKLLVKLYSFLARM